MINQIHNENCLDTMARMDDGLIALTVTSPPYDDMRTYEGIAFTPDEFKKIAAQLFRVTSPGGAVVWVVCDQVNDGDESGSSFRQALGFKAAGFKLHSTMIYEKPPPGAIGDTRSYWRSFEYMFVLSKGRIKTINLLYDRKNNNCSKPRQTTFRRRDGTMTSKRHTGQGQYGRRTNLWKYPRGGSHSTRDKIAYGHPAIFPERLAQDHILSWSDETDIVYDPFCGSGTTCKMAMLNRRRYIGSDISANYCRIARTRIEDAAGQNSLF